MHQWMGRIGWPIVNIQCHVILSKWRMLNGWIITVQLMKGCTAFDGWRSRTFNCYWFYQLNAWLISWMNYKLHQLNAVPVSSVEFLSIIRRTLCLQLNAWFSSVEHHPVFISWTVTSHQLNILHLDKITWHWIFTISHPILPIRW